MRAHEKNSPDANASGLASIIHALLNRTLFVVFFLGKSWMLCIQVCMCRVSGFYCIRELSTFEFRDSFRDSVEHQLRKFLHVAYDIFGRQVWKACVVCCFNLDI